MAINLEALFCSIIVSAVSWFIGWETRNRLQKDRIKDAYLTGYRDGLDRSLQILSEMSEKGEDKT